MTRDGESIEVNNPKVTLTGGRERWCSATGSSGSICLTDWPSSRAPGRSCVALVLTPGSQEGDGPLAASRSRHHESPPRRLSRPALAMRQGDEEHEESSTLQLKTLLILVGALAVAATASLSAASAKTHSFAALPPGRGADVEHVRGQRGSRLDADEGADRRDGLHVVRAGGGVRRRDEARGPLRALPRLRVRGRPRRLGAGGGRGGGADDARPLPARPAADRRRGVHGVPRNADGGRRGRRRGRRGGGAGHHRLPHRRRPQGGDAELRADRADPARAVAAAAESVGADAVAGDDAPVPARAGLAVPRRAAAVARRAASTRRT